MDVTGMIAELRLELDRIERSILILDTLASPNRAKRAMPIKHGRRSPARSASRSTSDVPSCTGKVISIVRAAGASHGNSGPFEEPAENDQAQRLHELRSETAKFQKALSALVQESGD
jgi:hypothetical protein